MVGVVVQSAGREITSEPARRLPSMAAVINVLDFILRHYGDVDE